MHEIRMKKYGDEDFIFLIGEVEQEDTGEPHENKITDGYIILEDEKHLFSEKVILDQGFSMIMPEEFIEMPKEIARIKYPSAQRPDIIWSNEETTINITFTLKEEQLAEEESEELRDLMKVILLRTNPGLKEIVSEKIEVEEKTIAYLEFVSPAIDADVYNLMIFLSLKERLLMGSFNCLLPDKSDWRELFFQMLHSIHFYTEE